MGWGASGWETDDSQSAKIPPLRVAYPHHGYVSPSNE